MWIKTQTAIFPESAISQLFKSAADYLLSPESVNVVRYEDRDVLTFRKGNVALLEPIRGRGIIYCIWEGEPGHPLESRYVGHVAPSISKERMVAHFCRKNEATGSKLANVTEAVKQGRVLGLSFMEIQPNYMRKALEEWLLNTYGNRFAWNIQGRKKEIKHQS